MCVCMILKLHINNHSESSVIMHCTTDEHGHTRANTNTVFIREERIMFLVFIWKHNQSKLIYPHGELQFLNVISSHDIYQVQDSKCTP